MFSVVDVLNELYSTDADNWAQTASNIFSILEFPVRIKSVCDWERLIYEETNTYKFLHNNDRSILKMCDGIALFCCEAAYSKLSVFSIYINSVPDSRNDDVNSITKLFRRLFGPFVILMFINNKEVAFSGIVSYADKKRETIISEWFGLAKADTINEKIIEINPAYYSYKNTKEFYYSYLWSIARCYMRLRESRMYLLYGCGTFIEDNSVSYNEANDSLIISTKIDADATFRANASYYPNMYGDDYFLDDVQADESEDDDLEWTLLELALEEEASIIESTRQTTETSSKEGRNSALSGLTPEQMLKYIRQN